MSTFSRDPHDPAAHESDCPRAGDDPAGMPCTCEAEGDSAEKDGLTSAEREVLYPVFAGRSTMPSELVPAVEQIVRERVAAARQEAADAVAFALEAPILEAWSSYMNGPGGKTEALRQGKYQGLDRARRLALLAILPPGATS